MNYNKRVHWLEIMDAMAIILVIIGHIDLMPKNGLAMNVEKLACVFQMPLFMFVSGYSFVRFTLAHQKYSYKDMMKSKFYRLYIPMMAFSVVIYACKLCVPSSLMIHSVTFDFTYILHLLFCPWKGPIPHLWFIMALIVIFALSPLYIWSLNKKYSIVIIGVVLLIVSIIIPIRTTYFSLEQVCGLLFYFYIGMVAEKINYTKWLDNWYALLITSFLFIGLYLIIPPHILALSYGYIIIITGIAMSTSLALFLDKKKPNTFKLFRGYTYQIYLLHMLPIQFFQLTYKISIFHHNRLYWIFWLAALVCAVIIPTIIARFVEKGPKAIRICFGLK